LLALADLDDRDGDGISGRLSRVRMADGRELPGRFGWKADAPDLLTQSALAFSLDLGLGSPLYPGSQGDCTETQYDCLLQVPGTSTGPHATELGAELLHLVLAYLESLEAPLRKPDAAGLALFARTGCAACHVPELPAPGGSVAAFTDLLLHDMGPGLADTLAADAAAAAEWRTPPLWGLAGATRLLHDGRANSLEAAVLWHGGEALGARQAFRALGEVQKRQLLDFIEGL
jgi:CxxC motif-containing protein (DUF1111 family)